MYKSVIVTPEVLDAKRQLLKAVRDAVLRADDVQKDEAFGALSWISCDVWDDGEQMLNELMRREPRG